MAVDGSHYEYAQFGTIGSSSARTYASTVSEMDYEKRDELGSTSHLMPLKVKSVSFFFNFIKYVLMWYGTSLTDVKETAEPSDKAHHLLDVGTFCLV